MKVGNVRVCVVELRELEFRELDVARNESGRRPLSSSRSCRGNTIVNDLILVYRFGPACRTRIAALGQPVVYTFLVECVSAFEDSAFVFKFIVA